jgi:hypothetical protein
MPGFGEFFIGNSAPMVTRIGVPNSFKADKVVEGGTDAISALTAAQPISDVSFATVLGLGQKCIGIQWGGGAFAIAGGAQNVHSFLFDVEGIEFDFPFEEDSCAAAASTDGKTWVARAPFNISSGTVAGRGTSGGSQLAVALAARINRQLVFRAAGAQLVPSASQAPNPPNITFTRLQPIQAESSDGINYGQIGAPDPGAGTNFDTFFVGLAVDRKTGTWYGLTQENTSSDAGLLIKLSGVGFAFDASFAPGDPVPPIPWPAGTVVVDASGARGSDTSAKGSFQYASSNDPGGQIVRFNDSTGLHTLEITGDPDIASQLLVDGSPVSAPFGNWASAAAGRGVIVGTTYDKDSPASEDNWPLNGYVYSSSDLGKSWTAVAVGATMPGGTGLIVSFA